jgi:hypothetical protein
VIVLTDAFAGPLLRHEVRDRADPPTRRRGGAQAARGPEAVLASLTTGLNRLGKPFRLNPSGLRGTTVVGVLSGLDALEAAIRWRRQSSQRRLLVGPNVAALPSVAPALMTAPEIDLCVVASEWVKGEFERDSPELIGRIGIWPAGVDVERWRPDGAAPRQIRRAVMFVKRLANHTSERVFDDAMLDAAWKALRGAGLEVTVLRYGQFAPDGFARALDGAELVVCFGYSETQGMALAEAWAMDVPTLVWNGGRTRWREHTYESSPAPYLSAATGAEFRTIEELHALVDRWDSLRPGFAPRDWVLSNMTDEICAQSYWDLAHAIHDGSAGGAAG